MAKAENYKNQGEFRAAAIEARNALKGNPNSGQARWLLGELHMKVGDAPAAEKELTRARELGVADDSTLPLLANALLLQGKSDEVLALESDRLSSVGESEVLVAKGLALMVKGKVDEAVPLIDKALSLDSQSDSAHVAKARILAIKRDYQEARDELNGVFERNASYAQAWSLLGDIELNEQHFELAENAYGKAIEYGANSLGDRLKRAQLLIQQKRYDEAQKDVDVLKKSAPRHAGVNYAQGLIYYLQDNLPEAQTAFEQAVLGNDRYLPPVYFLALTHFRQGNMAQAEQSAIELLAAAPDSPHSRKLMARINFENQQYDKVEELLRPVVILDDEDIVALNFLSSALLKQGKTEEAIGLLQKVVDLQPDSPEAQLRLGAGLVAGGEQSSGMEHIASAIELGPQFQQADIFLVLNYIRQREYDKALAAAEAYRDRNPNSATPYNMLGMVYLTTKRESDAQQAFSKARSIAPGDPSACQNLAVFALKTKDFDKARKYYEEILQYHDNHLQALLKLATVDALENKEDAMIGHLEQAMIAHPKEIQPRLVLARYYLTKNRSEQVAVLLNGLDEAQRSNPQVLSVTALYQLAVKEFIGAKLTLEQLISLQPDSAQTHHQLAQAYGGLKNRKRMVTELEKAVELAQDYFPAHLALTRISIQDGDKQLAEKRLAKLKEISSPDNPDVLQIEASLANLKGDQNMALKKAEQAFKISPTTSVMLLLARQKWRMGDRDGSIQLQEQWGREHPDDIAAQLSLANAYSLEDRTEEAVAHYRTILEYENDNLIALNNLAWYLRDSNASQALEYAELANDIEPESVFIMDTLAVVLMKNGEIEKAKRTIRKALKQLPDNQSIQYHSAMIDASAGDAVEAIRKLKTLLGSNSDFAEKDEAKKLLDQLEKSG